MDSTAKTPPKLEIVEKSQPIVESVSIEDQSRINVYLNNEEPPDISAKLLDTLSPLATKLEPSIAYRPGEDQPKPAVVRISVVNKFAVSNSDERVRAMAPILSKSEADPKTKEFFVVSDVSELINVANLPEADGQVPLPVQFEAVSSEQAQEKNLERVTVWRTELAKDDIEILEDFTVALVTFVEFAWMMTADEEGSHNNSAITGENIEENFSLPLVASQVAEKLQLLDADGKESVAPILKDIVGAVHGLLLLEEREANPEIIEQVQEQLEVLCIQLLESLGIDYDQNDLEQFIAMLLNPGFRPNLSAESASIPLDLADKGTHEAKKIISLADNNLNNLNRVPLLLGMLMLLNTSLSPTVS